MNNAPAILSLHYLPSIEWFHHFLAGDTVIDIHEHYLKQSYRNRCVILSANGPLALTIPVKKKDSKQPLATIEIENDFNWQKQHWEAIRSAYNSSPYFEFYAHYFEPFYTKPFTHLYAYNKALIELCLKLMKTGKPLVLSTKYIQEEDHDLRNSIHPKKPSGINNKPYLQVFTEKFPFQPNLSILDLLFNQGPASRDYI
jgi:hypothetical protein